MSNFPKPSFVFSQSNFSLFWFGATNQFLVVQDALEVFFNEALVHGTLPWTRTDRFRRSILFKYSPGFLSWGSPHTKCPITDPTPEESALYEPPRRTGRTAIGQT